MRPNQLARLRPAKHDRLDHKPPQIHCPTSSGAPLCLETYAAERLAYVLNSDTLGSTNLDHLANQARPATARRISLAMARSESPSPARRCQVPKSRANRISGRTDEAAFDVPPSSRA